MIKKKHGRIALVVFLVFIMSFGSVLVAFGSPGRSGERGNAGPPAFAGDAGAEAETEAEDTGTEADEPAVEADLVGDAEAGEEDGSEVEAEAEAGEAVEEVDLEETEGVNMDESDDNESDAEGEVEADEDGEVEADEDGEVEADEEGDPEVGADTEDSVEVKTEDAEELDADQQDDSKADVEGKVEADDETASEAAADNEDDEEVDTEDVEEAAFATFSTLLTSFIGLTSNAVTYTENWDGRGSDSERCDMVPLDNDDPRYDIYQETGGWIHWVFSTKGDSTDAKLELGGTGSGEYEPGEPLNAEVWHFYTPYFELDGLTATITLYGGMPGEGGGLVISDYCPGGEEELTVEKTVETSYIRTHDWEIDKEVETAGKDNGIPKIWLYPDGSGDETATWKVCVTYLGYEDSDFVVFGTITIENTGDLNAVITDIEDKLAGDKIDGIYFDDEYTDEYEGDPINLAKGATLTLYYREFVDGKIEGFNAVVVTTEVDEYGSGDVAIPDWGDPDEEIHASVEVTDTNEGFADNYGEVILEADDYEEGEQECFEYDELFKWEDFTCAGTYCSFEIENTAEVRGDDDELLDDADAKLKINWYDEELTVTKTVDTSYIREHFWDIDKKVETEKGSTVGEDTPKIWLYIDGSGDETATWTVDVTYEGFEDSGFVVFGTITIENTGDLDAVITDIEDKLAGCTIDIYYDEAYTNKYDPEGDPIDLVKDATLTLYYREFVESKITGFNAVVVTTEIREYGSGDVAIVWGDPTTEINKTVNIVDDSELFGEVNLGSVTAPNGDTFIYTKDFAWADYGADNCGSFTYDNTATIVETDQSASATLKVNVQCFIYESAWAKGEDSDRDEAVDADAVFSFCDEGFANWGWTNKITPGIYNWDLWAGAAQCDTSKGTLVGSVTVVYDDDGYVTVAFNVDAPYTLESTAVYADYGKFPQLPLGRSGRTRDTIAPGQYYNDSPFDGSEVYVIAHAVVGMPDPNFGP